MVWTAGYPCKLALIFGAMLLVQSTGTRSLGGSEPLRRANIVLLIADDLGYAELGCQGNSQVDTPHIDGLAASGVRCTQAYVTAPNCSPSRAGLFTGRTPTRFGYEFNPIGARNEDAGTGLPIAERTLAEHLKANGYTTGLIGKWHLGATADFHPLRRGFDEFFGFLHEGHYYAPPPWNGTTSLLRRQRVPGSSGTRYQVSANLFYSAHMGHDEPAYDANNPLLRGGTPVSETAYLTDAFTREAMEFIERYQATPFFLCVTYNAVHSPLQAKTQTLERFAHIADIHRRIFLAMLSDLDSSVGNILSTLELLKLRDNTLVIFLSDNGGPTRELTSSNLPLRDGKGSMYEGGLRVPCLFSWPSQLPSDEICTEIISSLDIFPTVASATLTRAAAPPELEGFDVLSLLKDRSQRTQHSRLYWRQGQRAALRKGSWKIVSPNARSSERVWELYNIDNDIAESKNLQSVEPDKLQELKDIWAELDASMAPPLF